MDLSRSLQHEAPGARGRMQVWFDSMTRRLAGAVPVETEDRTGLAAQTAPAFALVDLDGAMVTLTELLAHAQPLLLVFVDTRSTACHEFMPDIGGWQRVYGDRLTIALISTGEPDKNRAMTVEYGVQPVLLQHELEVIDAYGVQMAPAAVLIQPDGQIGAGPLYGPNHIRQLVADTLGLVLPPSPEVLHVKAVGRGEPAPAIRRPDLEGNIVDLSLFKGEPVLLLFWSPGCGYCQELLPYVLAFEQATTRVKMIVISGGAIGVNQELGFTSPIILDDDHVIAQSFGVAGTPAAVLIGSRGNVVSEVARGSGAVRSYIDRCQMPETTPFPD